MVSHFGSGWLKSSKMLQMHELVIVSDTEASSWPSPTRSSKLNESNNGVLLPRKLSLEVHVCSLGFEKMVVYQGVFICLCSFSIHEIIHSASTRSRYTRD